MTQYFKQFTVSSLLLVASILAQADVYAPYGQWTNLRYCGGQTRLICDNVSNARERNKCNIEFRNVNRCDWIKMYVDDNFYPTRGTYESYLKREFYVDNDWLNDGGYRDNRRDEYGRGDSWLDQLFGSYDDRLNGPWFNVYMSAGKHDNNPYEKIRYQFKY